MASDRLKTMRQLVWVAGRRRALSATLGSLGWVVVMLPTAQGAFAATEQRPPIEVVPNVDYQRYAGKWFEIARLPNRFEKDCVSDVTAEYEVRPDGRIGVTNRCIQEDGSAKVANGIARREKGRPPSVLEVRFAPAILSWWSGVWGDYRIIALDDDYQHAVVGSDDRTYLWILSRTSRLSEDAYTRLTERARGSRSSS